MREVRFSSPTVINMEEYAIEAAAIQRVIREGVRRPRVGGYERSSLIVGRRRVVVLWDKRRHYDLVITLWVGNDDDQ